MHMTKQSRAVAKEFAKATGRHHHPLHDNPYRALQSHVPRLPWQAERRARRRQMEQRERWLNGLSAEARRRLIERRRTTDQGTQKPE